MKLKVGTTKDSSFESSWLYEDVETAANKEEAKILANKVSSWTKCYEINWLDCNFRCDLG